MQERAHIVEVGARDGLQNEPTPLPVDVKLKLLRKLAQAGLSRIEAAALVSARRVPQMANAPELLAALDGLPPAQWSVLLANERGMAMLPAVGVAEVALFTAASDEFALRNIGKNAQDSLAAFAPLARAAKSRGLRLRGYVSTVTRCPYSGAVPPARVAEVARRLLQMGCDEVSLGETLGVAAPREIEKMLAAVLQEAPPQKLAAHFHDTCGVALANIACAFEKGLRVVDAAVAGLGGCPYAPGAGGNLATEDANYFLTAQGFDTGVNTAALAQTGKWICQKLRRPYTAKAGLACLAGRKDGQ